MECQENSEIQNDTFSQIKIRNYQNICMKYLKNHVKILENLEEQMIFFSFEKPSEI